MMKWRLMALAGILMGAAGIVITCGVLSVPGVSALSAAAVSVVLTAVTMWRERGSS